MHQDIGYPINTKNSDIRERWDSKPIDFDDGSWASCGSSTREWSRLS